MRDFTVRSVLPNRGARHLQRGDFADANVIEMHRMIVVRGTVADQRSGMPVNGVRLGASFDRHCRRACSAHVAPPLRLCHTSLLPSALIRLRARHMWAQAAPRGRRNFEWQPDRPFKHCARRVCDGGAKLCLRHALHSASDRRCTILLSSARSLQSGVCVFLRGLLAVPRRLSLSLQCWLRTGLPATISLPISRDLPSATCRLTDHRSLPSVCPHRTCPSASAARSSLCAHCAGTIA